MDRYELKLIEDFRYHDLIICTYVFQEKKLQLCEYSINQKNCL